MKRPWIKFCGFTQPADVEAAVQAGCDLIGLNFFPGSPRAVSFGLGQVLVSAMTRAAAARETGRKVRSVAVFVDPDPRLVAGVLSAVGPDILQFHGAETPDFCRSFGHPYLKAFSVSSAADAGRFEPYLGPLSVGYMVDALSPHARGGTGQMLGLDTARAVLQADRGFLAGGLNPDNIQALVRELKPFGVDAASGIETRPGIKSPDKMLSFVQQVEAGCSV